MSSKEAKETVPPTATYIAGVTGLVGWLVVVFLKSDILALLYFVLWIFSHLIIWGGIISLVSLEETPLPVNQTSTKMTWEKHVQWNGSATGRPNLSVLNTCGWAAVPAEAFHVAGWDLQLEAIAAVHAVVPLALAAARHMTGGLGWGSGAGGRCTDQHNT